MFSFKWNRAKWLSAALIVLVSALVSGNLTANELGFFSNTSSSLLPAMDKGLEPMLWVLGSALLGMIGLKRFDALK